MRRHLQQTFDSSSYDVLEANPWRDPSKPVYVLTHKENQLCTMKTRRNLSEVETELGLLFSKGAKRSSRRGSKTEQPRSGTKFDMLVEDVREGVLVSVDLFFSSIIVYCCWCFVIPDSSPAIKLKHDIHVFEDENEAAKYCDLMQGGGKGCEGVAEIEASSVLNTEMMKRAENTDWKKIYIEFGVLKHKIVLDVLA
ncbi:hypothetical protein like AT1G13990 [Hibiscus trionum]|uniref:Uncharacterized protein n=1 Tax=Hibiscus trionum TaxID=183268 RepID=A0A9W7MKK5_HIBTR|nr:hypothetical protein like AT1G13990 [Hibiscus trionum]